MNRLRPGSTARPPMGFGTVDSLTGRTRINLASGHSLMDWIRLGRDKGDLSGVGSRKRPVSLDELSDHDTEKDLWMAIKGKVYNITAYVDFHPGGVDELMRAAGADGTQLFEEIHGWVNVESMLSKCLIGPLLGFGPNMSYHVNIAGGGPTAKQRNSIASSTGNTGPSDQLEASCPTHDWYQTENEVKVVIYTKHPGYQDHSVLVDITAHEVTIEALISGFSYFVHFKPVDKLEDTCSVSAVNEKAEICFKKTVLINWPALGTPLKLNKDFTRTIHAEPRFWYWTTVSNTKVTHDTRLIGLKAPTGTRVVVPIGYHIVVYLKIQGMELARSYTVVVPSLLRDPAINSKVVPNKDNILHLMIKSYVGGAISPWITAVKPGDHVKLSRYDGSFDIKSLDGVTDLVMFVAGTGFTSIIRIVYHCLYEMKDPPASLQLVFFNKTEEDILWRDQLNTLDKQFDSFTVTHILSKQSSTWKGMTGRVSMDHIKKFVPKPDKKRKPLLLVCGQFAYNEAVLSLAKNHGLERKQIHSFSGVSWKL